MKQLTNRQYEYRAYLTTPLWKEIREKAINHYGPICNRCGQYGTDVHHKTYERVGGDEKIEDLEVMCRGCHEAHHKVENVSKHGKKKKRERSLHVKGVISYLTKKQKDKIYSEFEVNIDLLLYSLNKRGSKARDMAMEMLNINLIYGIPQGIKKGCYYFSQKLGKEPFNLNYHISGKKKKNRPKNKTNVNRETERQKLFKATGGKKSV